MADRSFMNKVQDFGLALGGNFDALSDVRKQRMLGEELQQNKAAARQQRSGELSEERKKAAATDFRELKMALDAGYIDQARTRINDRLRIGSLLPDFDAVSSQHVKDLMDSGNIEEAKKFLDFADKAAVMRGYLDPVQAPEPVKLGADDRLVDPASGREVIGASQSAPVSPLPESILTTIPEPLRPAAQEAFRVAGGGTAGLNAAQDVVARDREATTNQQEAAAQEQSSNKARGVQLQAIKLAAGLLANPETKDVVGPMQGRGFNNLFDADNTQAVADIEELANILTSDNLDLLQGVLSDTDIKMLRSVAAGGLDRRRDDATFMRRVGDIVFSLANSAELTEQDLGRLSTEELEAYSELLESRR